MTLIITILYFGCLLNGVFGGGNILRLNNHNTDDKDEAIVDKFIYETIQELKKNHQEQIVVPDFTETIGKKISFLFTLSGTFTGKDGWFRDLTTLKKTSKSEVLRNSNKIILSINLSLNDFQFGFKEYDVSFLSYVLKGTLRANVNKNSMFLHLIMDFNDDDTCKTTLDNVGINRLEGIHLFMTGLGTIGDWVSSAVASVLADKYHDKIETVVTDFLKPALQEVLANNDICKDFANI